MGQPQRGHILLLTGSAPYLGGASTWKPLRDAAQDLEFRDLDLLELPPGGASTTAMKQVIKTAAEGAAAIVAHGAVAAIVLETVNDFSLTVPVLLLSPIPITKDSLKLRFFRALLRGPIGNILASVATSKRRKLLNDAGYLRKQLGFVVREDAITPELLQEAHERVADPRMEAFCTSTAETLLTILTPTNAFERFDGVTLFGNGRMDLKASKRIGGIVLAAARSSPMIEAPHQVAEHLYSLLLTRPHQTGTIATRP